VTRERVHLDRVAAPWLIRRFIDSEAEFLFICVDAAQELPASAVPFGLPGVELSSHDAHGSTFRKIIGKYKLNDPALDLLTAIVEDGIDWFLAGHRGQHRNAGALRHPEAIGIEAISRGMMLAASDDSENIRFSEPIYDALYAWCASQAS